MEKYETSKIGQRDLRRLYLQVRRRYGLVARKSQNGKDQQEFMVGRANAPKSNSSSRVKPSYEQIHSTAMSIGFVDAEAIALSALLFSIWSHFNPKTASEASKCRKLANGRRCGHEFVYQEKVVEDDVEYIILWCIKKHETKLRVS
jgi:hypothetical protein